MYLKFIQNIFSLGLLSNVILKTKCNVKQNCSIYTASFFIQIIFKLIKPIYNN